MNVASSDLSRELYSLSGWTTELMVHSAIHGRYYEYDLGYLLRKLQPLQASIRANGGGYYEAECEHESVMSEHGWDGSPGYEFTGDTPEDALTKLAIELHKAGILTKEGTTNE